MFDILAFKNQEIDQEFTTQESIKQLIFPKQIGLKSQSVEQYLKKYYNHECHKQQVQNCCYRCHDSNILRVYENFLRNEGHKVEQPTISMFFPNSYFINLKQLAQWITAGQIPLKYPGHFISPLPQNFKQMLDRIFSEYGYIPNLERLLLFYPTYLQKHLKLSKELFQSNQLDATVIYFVAICSAAEIGSLYVMNRMIKKFKQAGGDMEWVFNQKYPQKIRSILLLSRKMGRSLWEIDSEMLQVILCKGQWNSIQFMHICQVIAFTQQMSTICLGMGLLCQQKPAFAQLKKINLQIIKNNELVTPTLEKGERLIKVLPSLSDLQSELESASQSMRKHIKRSFRRLQSEEDIEGYMKQIAKQLSSQQIYKLINKQLTPLLPPFEVVEKRDQQLYPPFDFTDYNFKFHAFPILNSLAPTSSNAFLDLVNYSNDMTLSNFGKQKAEKGTQSFRKGMCFYSQNLCGYTHREYDYKNNLKKYLTMPFKFQIRLLTYSPIHITKQVIDELRHDQSQIGCLDNGHTSILIGNTKMSLAMMMIVKAYEQINE